MGDFTELPEGWETFSPEQKSDLLRQTTQAVYAAGLIVRPWRNTARPKQLAPDDPKHHLPDAVGFTCGCKGNDTSYRIWLILTGRGFGKTFTGSNWILEQALKHPGTVWGVAAPTANELLQVCFEGPAGIISQALPGDIAEIRPKQIDYNKNQHRIRLFNGSTIQGFSADRPDRIRGQNLSGLWFDEAAAARYQDVFWAVARPAVRIGDSPKILITTTPRPTPLLRKLVKDPDCHVVKGRMIENTHLGGSVVQDLLSEFGGTRMGRQELEGELLEDFEGALFSRADLDAARISPDEIPGLTRVVIGLDPAMTYSEVSDESGIIVVGEVPAPDGHGDAFVIEDLSFRGSPNQVAERVASAARKWSADCVVVETNQGGAWVADTIRTVAPDLRVKQVTARKNKVLRAEPVAALAEQGRLHLCGVFAELEDQLTCLIPGEIPLKSPDRADALVWAIFELRQISQASYTQAYGFQACACGEILRKDIRECPECAAKLVPVDLDPEPVAEDRGWHTAYMKRCPEGHSFPRMQAKCPQCHISVETYMRQVSQFSGIGDRGARTPGLKHIWSKTRA